MTSLPVRIMVQDVWDQVALSLPAAATVQEAKTRALALTHAAGRPDDYLVKFRGAAIDDGRSLAEAGVVPNAALIVMPRRRRPVR
jgi:hypothetical protein